MRKADHQLNTTLTSRSSRVYLADPDFRKDACAVKFTLTYEGPLWTNMKKRRTQGPTIRRQFHSQLERIWRINPFLSNFAVVANGITVDAKEWLASHYASFPECHFIPLVTEHFCVECALDLKILRPSDVPGEMPDIDNQVKSLIDALKSPKTRDHLGDVTGINPYFVLMDDDRLITKISSTSDELLYPVSNKASIDSHDCRVSIDVYIRPLLPTVNNTIFFAEDGGVWDHKYDEKIPIGLASASDQELCSIATQCLFRIRAMAAGFDLWNRDRDIAGITKNRSSVGLLDDIRTQQQLWNSGLRNRAFAIRQELLQRIYGEPPYPKEYDSVAILYGSLAGPRPVAEAALCIESLINLLSVRR